MNNLKEDGNHNPLLFQNEPEDIKGNDTRYERTA